MYVYVFPLDSRGSSRLSKQCCLIQLVLSWEILSLWRRSRKSGRLFIHGQHKSRFQHNSLHVYVKPCRGSRNGLHCHSHGTWFERYRKSDIQRESILHWYVSTSRYRSCRIIRSPRIREFFHHYFEYSIM